MSGYDYDRTFQCAGCGVTKRVVQCEKQIVDYGDPLRICCKCVNGHERMCADACGRPAARGIFNGKYLRNLCDEHAEREDAKQVCELEPPGTRGCGFPQCHKHVLRGALYCGEHVAMVYGRTRLKGHKAYGVAVNEAVNYSAPVVQLPPVWTLQCKVCRVAFEAPSRTPQWCATCSAERTRRESAPGIEAKFKYVTKPETRRAVEVVIDNSFWED